MPRLCGFLCVSYEVWGLTASGQMQKDHAASRLGCVVPVIYDLSGLWQILLSDRRGKRYKDRNEDQPENNHQQREPPIQPRRFIRRTHRNFLLYHFQILTENKAALKSLTASDALEGFGYVFVGVFQGYRAAVGAGGGVFGFG